MTEVETFNSCVSSTTWMMTTANQKHQNRLIFYDSRCITCCSGVMLWCNIIIHDTILLLLTMKVTIKMTVTIKTTVIVNDLSEVHNLFGKRAWQNIKVWFQWTRVMACVRASIAPQNAFPSKTLAHRTYTAPVFRRKRTAYGTPLTYSFIDISRSNAYGHSIQRPYSLFPILFFFSCPSNLFNTSAISSESSR